MLPPVAQREAPALAVPPLEPSTPFAARVGAGIFASLALLLLVLALLPGADGPVLARLGIPLACALAALALKVNSDRVGLSASTSRRLWGRCWYRPPCSSPTM